MCGRIVFNFNAFHNALSLIKLFKNQKKSTSGLISLCSTLQSCQQSLGAGT